MIVHQSISGATGPLEYRLAMGRGDFFALQATVNAAIATLQDSMPETQDGMRVYALLQLIAWEMEHPKNVP